VDNDGDGEDQSSVDVLGRKMADWKDNDGDGQIDEGIDEDCRYSRDGMAFVVTNERGESTEIGYVLAKDPSDGKLKLWRYRDSTPDGYIPANDPQASTDGLFPVPPISDSTGELSQASTPETGSEWQVLSEHVQSVSFLYWACYCGGALKLHTGWDPPGDANGDGKPGIAWVDDDGDGALDEGETSDDDEDGTSDECDAAGPAAVQIHVALRSRQAETPISISELVYLGGRGKTSSVGGSPVAHWRFDAAVNSIARDVSGNGHDLHLVDAALTNDAPRPGLGKSLQLNGTTAYGWAEKSEDFGNLKTFTICAWIKPAASWNGSGRIVCRRHDVVGNGFALVAGSSLLIDSWFEYRNYIRSPNPVPKATWTHVALTYDDAMLLGREFVNCVPVGEVACDRHLTSASYPLCIGRQADRPANFFNGQIGEVKIYDYVRSSIQIGQDMLR